VLIEMSVTNFRSLKETQRFSMLKNKGNELLESNVFNVSAAGEFELLRSAVIYGANASGKSNFLMALDTMEEIVLHSALGQQSGDPLSVEPFRLDDISRQSPSEFEVIFVVDGVRYQYGFSATQERIHEEWLMAFPKGRAQRWFDRSWNEESQAYQWDLGKNLFGEKQLWQKSTRSNALFLSTAVQLNSEQLAPVFDWFKNRLCYVGGRGIGASYTATLCESEEKHKVLKFLKAADLNIDDIVVESKKFDANALPDNFSQEMKREVMQNLGDVHLMDIKTVRNTTNGEPVTFDFKEESDGTQKLFAFAGPWVDVLENGRVLLVDELHSKLHPKLVEFLVRLFHDNKTNPHNAQLVFTTHETSILNQDVFRRDQIWFCEKNTQHSTEVYSLTDFSPRKNRENLESAYLSGRYGSLPFVNPTLVF